MAHCCCLSTRQYFPSLGFPVSPHRPFKLRLKTGGLGALPLCRVAQACGSVPPHDAPKSGRLHIGSSGAFTCEHNRNIATICCGAFAAIAEIQLVGSDNGTMPSNFDVQNVKVMYNSGTW
eukprot:6475180-Amphidinium_carterae.1